MRWEGVRKAFRWYELANSSNGWARDWTGLVPDFGAGSPGSRMPEPAGVSPGRADSGADVGRNIVSFAFRAL